MTGSLTRSPALGIGAFAELTLVAAGQATKVDRRAIDPQPPGQETNWISTSKGRPFFLLFRNYAPEKSVLERTSSWVLNDVEKTN